MKKRVLSLFMALALCLTMLPTAAFAETSDAAAQTAGGTTDTGGAYTIDKDTAAPDQEERDALSVWALRAESSEHAHCVCGVKGCEKWLVTASGSHTKAISFSDNAISQDAEGLKINGTVWEKRELKTSDNTVVGYYYRLPAGDYYLTTDLDLEDAYIATATGTVNLCLNGHSIQTTAKRTIYVSNERTTATLNLCDCKGTSGTYGEITHTSGASGVGVEVRTENKFNMYGGRITGNNRSGVDTSGGYFTMYGGEISGNSISNSDAQGGGGVTIGGQSFTMYGGSISNNSADYGGGVGWYSYGKFYMYGGEITGNTATTAGGGVYTRNDRVYVKGAVKITGNSTTDGKANNVCLGSVSGYPSDHFVLDGALKEGSKLGVTLGSGHDGLITEGWKTKMPDVTADQLTDHFISDASGMKFDLNSAGEVTLTAIPHKHLLCGTACSHGGEQHTKILTWTAVSSLSEITKAGHYYLTQDIETTDIWVPANGVVLCLNGHSIINTNHGYTIMVRKDYTFTLCDCKGDSAEYGRITHAEQADGTKYSGRGVYAIGTFNMYGGSISGNVSPDSSGVLLDNGANSGGKGTAFNMYGGEITGNTATSGAGGGVYVFANSPFRMYGGSISGNTAKYGGGVYVGSGSVFTVSGSVTITGNTDNDGSACNVQLAKGNTAGMTFAIGEGGLAESARIGVTADAAPAIGEHIAVATGADNGYYEGSITSDAGGQYGILREGDEINLYNGLPHKHLLCGTACSHGGETHTDVLTWTAVSSLSEITKAGHYYLTQSVTQSSEWQPVDGVVLCLNGYDIICSKDGANTIKLANGGSFTLSDCKGTGRITHTDGLTGTGVYLDPDGTFTMYGGSISGNSAAEKGGGVYMTRSTFRMLGGSVSGNKAKYGGGVYVYSGVFTLSGGTVSGNSSDEDGAGVYTAGTFNMTGGSVSGNFTTDAAVTGFATKRGGVYAAYVFNMSGGTISGNTAAEYGGGVYVILSAACTITGGTISGNTSGNSKGGGVCAGNKLTVSGAPCITGNLGKDGAANNVYLGRREIIHVGGALESGASIGVTTADPVIDGSYVRVADGTGLAADTTSYFTSDAYPGCTKRLMGDSDIFSSGTLHEHAVCGRSDCTDAAHGNTAWIPLTSVDGKLLYGGANASKNGDSYMLYAGNYYLAADIELDGRLFLAGDVNLCLNGKQITTTNTSVSAVVDDHWGLTLCDCRGNGRIAAPGETVNGVSSSQSFTMYGGTISGGRYGAYIYDDHGAFRMLGGKITGSQTGIYRNSSRNSLTIGGDANVTGSTRNVYLDSGVLTIDPSLTQAARIGITTSRQPTDDVPVQFAAGASSTALDYTKIFLPDASGQGYVVMQEQDKLYLRKHQHSWAYTASGTTITAACTNADGTCPDTNGGSVTLSAPDQTLFYNGMARAASCTSSLTTGDAAIITYYAKPADTTALSGAPVNAGDYIARIQLGEASVSVSYTIEKVRLLVTANSTVIDYGTAPMHDGVSCQGFVNNEDIDDLDGTLTYAHTYRQFGDVGEYTITPGGLTSDNYDISFLPGTLEVRPRTVTLTWHNTEGRIYADDEGAITATVSNAVNGDRIGVTLIAQPTGITADITKAAITVTPDAGQGKTYGEDDPTLTFAVSAAANGESPAFDGALTRASGENAGSYAIAIGSLKLADRGAFKADNYTLALAPDTVYFRIDRAPHADVTASGAAMYGNPGSVDLRSLIADGGAASLGDVTDTDSVLDGAPAVSGSTLRFAFRNEPANADKTAVIAVHVNGADNYLDYTITVTVTVDSRIVPTGQPTLTPAAITYGQPLRTIALSGALRDGDTVVEGTFVWNTPDVILPAGSQTAEWTFTPSGSRYATTSGTASVTVREAALTDVSVRQDGALTYTGTALSAPVITSAATVDGSAVTFTYSLAKDGAYGDAVPALTDVAAHTVWYKAEAANHETVTGSFTVTIGKAALTSVSVRQDGALAYNGKAQTARMAASAATVDGSAVTFTYSAEENGIYGPAVPAFSAAGTYTVWYKAEAASHEAVTGSVDITIDKGVLPDPTVTVDVTNNYAAAYSVDLRAVLDAILPTGCQLGAVEYGGLNFEGDETYYDVMRSTLSNKGVLTLAINAVDTDTEGLAATVRVIVTTGSYQDITITVRLNAVNKTVPAGGPTLSRTTLDYGQRLGTIRLSGAMQDGDTVVKGVFTWAEPSLCPASGSYDAEWLFTPEDDSRYAAVSGTSAITVNAPAGKTYNVGGTVLEYGITGSSEQPLEGAVVTIRRGMDIYGQSQATDADGHFHIGQLLPGTYNAVIAYNGKTVTAKLQIVDKDAVLTVRIPREDVSSELEIADPTDLTEHTVVGGLDAEAEKQFSDVGDASVALSMTIREQPQDDSSAAQNAIRELVKNKTLRFVDMTLTMVRNGQLSELKDAGTVLEIILPCDTSRSITVARCHADGNGQAQAMLLTQSTTGAEGTFYVDREGQCIHIFASKFSTYAIGYGRTSNSGHVPDDGEKTSPTTADAGLLAYGIAALGSYTGTALLLRRRKRED